MDTMPKAARKNTTPAKQRAAPDPIVKLIDQADNLLGEYMRAESNLSAAQDHMRSTADEFDGITKAMAKEKPITRAGAMALFDYARIRTAPRVSSIQCIRQEANLFGLLSHAYAVLKKSEPAA
jgi:hypothetical protein